MSPDFEYFIRMRLKGMHGHDLLGTLYFDLPVTIICTLLFHWLVRDTLISHLPSFLRKKYEIYYQQDWFHYARRNWIVIVYSAMIGIFSHLAWDAFTHSNGFFVQYISFLQQTVKVFNVDVPCYDLMQLISTFIGGIIILVYILWPSNQFIKDQDWKKTIRYCTFVLAITFVILILRDADSQNEFIATSLSGGLIGMMIAPFFLKFKKL